MSGPITEFINARLDEAEADAKLAMDGLRKTGVWTLDGATIYDGHPVNDVVDWVYDEAWAHIARHDPAYVLADIAAKRRILAAWPDPFGNWSAEEAAAARAVKDRVLRLLAAPFSSHPDYRPEWSVSE